MWSVTTNICLDEDRGKISLQEDIWESENSLSEWQAMSLVEEFSEKEIKEALDEMKTNTTTYWILQSFLGADKRTSARDV
jgi:hypothetical protein